MNDDLQLISEDSIGLLVVDVMHIAERDRSMVGIDKKVFVLQTTKTVLGKETYERYAPLLGIMIDLLVSISRNDIELCLNRTKTCLKVFGSC